MRWIKFISTATPSIFLFLFLFPLLIGLGPDKVQAQGEDRGEDMAEITDAGSEASQNASFIEFKHDHLSVKVQDISLKELLEEIARQGDLTLMVNTSLQERVTLLY